jgi:hypothetical protein
MEYNTSHFKTAAFLLAPILFALPGSAFAQQPTTARSARTIPAVPPAIYFTGTFSVASEKLPPSFIGQDIEAVIRKMTTSAGGLTKLEFETTEQYEERLQSTINPSPLIFALRVGEDDGDVVSFQYNADSQMMTAHLWRVLPFGSSYVPADLRPRFEVLIKRRVVGKSKYLGANAYGAKTVVHSEKHAEFSLAFSNGLLASKDGAFSWPMTVGAAREAKPFLRVAVVAVQNQSTLYTDESQSKPTMETPVEFITRRSYFPAEVIEVWIYDFRSGKVYEKFASEKVTR